MGRDQKKNKAVPPTPMSRELRDRLKSIVKDERKKKELANVSDIKAYISGLPREDSEEYRELSIEAQGLLNAAFYRADQAYKNLIVMSSLSSEKRFALVESMLSLRPFTNSSEVCDLLRDTYPRAQTPEDRQTFQDLYVLMSKATSIPSNFRIQLALVLNNKHVMGPARDCFVNIASDPKANPIDRAESSKFLCTSEDQEHHELAQEVLISIITDHSIGAAEETEEVSEGEEEVESVDFTSSSSETSDYMPDFLKSEDEDDGGGDGSSASLEGWSDDMAEIALLKPIPDSSKRAEELKAKRLLRLEETRPLREFNKVQKRTEPSSNKRYSILRDFLEVNTTKTKEENRSLPRQVNPVTGKKEYQMVIVEKTSRVIKSTYNRQPLQPQMNLDVFVYPLLMIFAKDAENSIASKIQAISNTLQINAKFQTRLARNPDSARFIPFTTEALSEEYSLLRQELYGYATLEVGTPNIKADAADTLMRLARTAEERDEALKIIIDIGYATIDKRNPELINRIKTIYTNSQNVHLSQVEEAVVNFVNSIPQRELKEPEYSFQEIAVEVNKLFREYELTKTQAQNAKKALYRISIDTATVGEMEYSVEFIFCYIWSFIQHLAEAHEEKEERAAEKGKELEPVVDLERRFVDELVDMGDTCTTGHINRLVYVLDGHGVDFKISYRDQIIASVSGRVTAKIRDVEDPTIKEALDVGMSEDLASGEQKEIYMTFITDALVEVYHELKSEYSVVAKPNHRRVASITPDHGPEITEAEFNENFDAGTKEWLPDSVDFMSIIAARPVPDRPEKTRSTPPERTRPETKRAVRREPARSPSPKLRRKKKVSRSSSSSESIQSRSRSSSGSSSGSSRSSGSPPRRRGVQKPKPKPVQKRGQKSSRYQVPTEY